MALATWWSGDTVPLLRPLPGFRVVRAWDDARLAWLNQIPRSEVRRRRREDHRPYVGYMNGAPVAYGWVATRQSSIGELGLSFRLPPGNRYLWDFATLPEWQGRGIYPQLLQAILAEESATAGRFWIIQAPENLPSGAGMHKAGWLPVGELSFRPGGAVGLAPLGSLERARAGAALLGVALVESPLSPCWRCAAGQEQRDDTHGCAASSVPSGTGACSCAVPVHPSRTEAGGRAA